MVLWQNSFIFTFLHLTSKGKKTGFFYNQTVLITQPSLTYKAVIVIFRCFLPLIQNLLAWASKFFLLNQKIVVVSWLVLGETYYSIQTQMVGRGPRGRWSDIASPFNPLHPETQRKKKLFSSSHYNDDNNRDIFYIKNI